MCASLVTLAFSSSTARTNRTTTATKRWHSINRKPPILPAPQNDRPTHSLDLVHPYLHVNKILRHAAPELVASDGEAYAVSLACCCEDFEDSVLDALWETQEQLTPVFETLPEDVRYHDECGVSVPTISLSVHSTTRFYSLLEGSRRSRNGLDSEGMLEGCEGLKRMVTCTSCPRSFSRCWSFVHSTNLCF